MQWWILIRKRTRNWYSLGFDCSLFADKPRQPSLLLQWETISQVRTFHCLSVRAVKLISWRFRVLWRDWIVISLIISWPYIPWVLTRGLSRSARYPPILLLFFILAQVDQHDDNRPRMNVRPQCKLAIYHFASRFDSPTMCTDKMSTRNQSEV